ncbi:prolyl oligopeptidase family serine peptidase [bacterium]|nr:prolyl oligopeptidase family serine peptidase [bacterium]
MRIAIAAAILCLIPVDLIFAQVPALPGYPDHAKLLVVRDAAGNESPVKSPADWAVRRAHIVSNFEKVAGKLPGGERRVTLDVKVDATTDEGSYLRHHINYAVEPGDRATAWLLVPKDIKPGEKRAGIVAIHQTTKIGKDEPANVGGLSNLHYGAELARRGHVVICPDYHRFGERMVDPYKTGWESATMKGIWDHMRAVDVLQSRPEVDGSKIAAIGHSLGGHNSIFLAVFDPRVKSVVSSCGYNAFPHYMKGNIAGWSHEGYMPKLKSEFGLDLKKVPFDWPELVAALAPRGLYTCAPTGDDNFDVAGVKACETAARPVYEIFGASGNLVFSHPDAKHDFPQEQREEAYRFIESQLK